MTLNLSKPEEGDVGWADEVNQNFTEIETRVNALGTMADQDASAVAITGGSITGITDLAIADGGTGASDVAAARANLGLGTIATQDASAVTITGGTLSGITDLAVADGGTGASDAASARMNLGLGTVATQDASAVTITGGMVSGITDLAVADGGTGASDVASAQANLQVPPRSRTINTAAPLSGGGDLTADRTISLGTVPVSLGGTGQTTYAQGDILYASAANTLSKLAAGTNGHVLTLVGGAPAWAAASGAFDVLSVQDLSAGPTSASFNVPANTLTTNGESLLVLAAGTLDDLETIVVTFGGTTVGSFAMPDLDGSAWFLVGVLTRTGAASQVFSGFVLGENDAEGIALAVVKINVRGTSAVSLSSDQALVVNTQGESDDHVYLLHVSKMGAA